MTKELRAYAENIAPFDDIQISKHFNLKEFQCGMGAGCWHCNGKSFISPQLALMLEDIREVTGRPIRILSGYRCEGHNIDIGGSTNSAHVVGFAADLAVPEGLNFTQFHEACLSVVKRYHGGCGAYPSQKFVHVDVRCVPPDRRWTS